MLTRCQYAETSRLWQLGHLVVSHVRKPTTFFVVPRCQHAETSRLWRLGHLVVSHIRKPTTFSVLPRCQYAGISRLRQLGRLVVPHVRKPTTACTTTTQDICKGNADVAIVTLCRFGLGLLSCGLRFVLECRRETMTATYELFQAPKKQNLIIQLLTFP